MSVTAERIISICERVYNLPHGKIMTHDRHKTVALARNVAMYMCRLHTSLSFTEIGFVFRRHHTSGVKAIKRIEKLHADDQRLSKVVDSIEWAITNDEAIYERH